MFVFFFFGRKLSHDNAFLQCSLKCPLLALLATGSCSREIRLIRSAPAVPPLLCSKRAMPGSASKQKEVIDPAEEKEEPEARDRDSNWKNAMLMLLPKSILPARSCCGCGALCWTFGDSQIWRGVWQIPCIRKHLQTAYERCRKPKEATRNYLRLQTGRRGSRQPSCSQHRLFEGG